MRRLAPRWARWRSLFINGGRVVVVASRDGRTSCALRTDGYPFKLRTWLLTPEPQGTVANWRA